ncbi:MAG: zf-HC2 domain-containing protein [candidate division Zixibacteria bacterium]|nr:zf-HC2 domain-containing protein [candidate division Zixibacteria bacterium]
MKCEDFDELIYLFWDGRIDERKREELEKHLSTCKRCKEKLVLLESIEKGAKEIKIKEPSQEYWDTFSNRVRERIVAQKEKSFSSKLKKVFENVFTFSPSKIKVAAGVISIVLVFIVGKLYVDYRGKEIVPTIPRIESTKEPAPYAPELKKQVVPLGEKVKKKEEVTTAPDELEKAVAPPIVPEEKTIPVTPLEEKVRKKDEITPPHGELEGPVVPQIIPEEKTTPEMVESKEEILSPETYTTGAGEAKEKNVLRSMSKLDRREEKRSPIPPVKAESSYSEVLAYTLGFVKYYKVNDEKVPDLKYQYPFPKEDELRKIIDTWNKYIEKNPKDSLANQGYLQVAIGYYLLSKLTQDDSDVLKGIELLEKYEKQVTDPKTKEELNKKLKQLKALKEKFSPK